MYVRLKKVDYLNNKMFKISCPFIWLLSIDSH